MDTLLKDLRYVVRYLVKQPAFTLVAILTLALGIGANTTIFSVIYALILNPPLFTEPKGQNVVRLVLRERLVLAVLGAVLGLGIAFGLSRLIESLLFEVKPADLLTFGGSTVVLFVCALLASYVPARRATKVDPLVALRYE
jgi:putative ABC transport system permease protein